jgi:hypothetical protein
MNFPPSIPERMHNGIQRYIEHGIPPGKFLTAIIQNDLAGACYAADDENLHLLPEYVKFFYNEVPGIAWGSQERMIGWIAKRQQEQAKKNATI